MTTRIKWIGHSTVLLNEGDTWILTDPVLRRRVAHLMRRKRMLPADWPQRVDAVLISHLHHDHLDVPSLRKLGMDRFILIPAGAGDWLRRKGFSNVHEIAVGESMQIEEITISAVPARHSGHRPPFGPRVDALGYLMEGKRTTYFAGDTDLFPGMSLLADDLDVALLPVWGWGSSLGEGHLDPLRAAEAVRILKPRMVIPIHWGTLHPVTSALGKLSFLSDPPEQFELAASRLAPDTDIRVLNPGEEIAIE